MIIQFIFSPISIRNLNRLGNPSQVIEWLVRRYNNSFPTPYVVKNAYGRQPLTANLTPYTIQILKGFTQFGINPSQVVEWLLVTYMNEIKIEPEQPKPQPTKVQKPAHVRTPTLGTKKPKIKPRN